MNSKLQSFLAFILGALFGGVAFCIYWCILSTYVIHYNAEKWIPVNATVIDYGVKTSKSGVGSRSTQHSKLYLSYEYTYNGIVYSGNRPDFSFGSDNFSDKRIYSQLRRLNAGSVSVYVNPVFPSQSVFDRTLPSSQIAFAIFFLFFPCGFGTVAIFGCIAFLLQKSGIHTDRYMMPALGIIHGCPAIYPVFFDPSSLNFGAWIIIALFCCLFLISFCILIMRLIVQDPHVL